MKEWTTLTTHKGFEIQFLYDARSCRVNDPIFSPETRRFNPYDALNEIDRLMSS
ncbi:MAG TPA: hypothetical protein IAA29_11985 [Candidatus Paenibacillus intestinavium]|nr:hypothetical protein [Candidatus Paenibacillus intestinavium]